MPQVRLSNEQASHCNTLTLGITVLWPHTRWIWCSLCQCINCTLIMHACSSDRKPRSTANYWEVCTIPALYMGDLCVSALSNPLLSSRSHCSLCTLCESVCIFTVHAAKIPLRTFDPSFLNVFFLYGSCLSFSAAKEHEPVESIIFSQGSWTPGCIKASTAFYIKHSLAGPQNLFVFAINVPRAKVMYKVHLDKILFT